MQTRILECVRVLAIGATAETVAACLGLDDLAVAWTLARLALLGFVRCEGGLWLPC